MRGIPPVPPLLLCAVLGAGTGLSAQDSPPYRLGGSGAAWPQVVDFELMIDGSASSGSIQPVELHPDRNLLPRLGPWWERRSSRDPTYREGHPRAWQGVNATAYAEYTQQTQTARWVDGDPATYTELWDVGPHFYTIDLGAPVYADRFVFYPPRQGESVNTGDPFYPKYVLQKYELYGAGSEEGGQLLEEKLKGTSYDPRLDFAGTGACCPLESLLGSDDSNADTVTVVDFPLQRLRFFRLLLQADSFRGNGTPVVDFWANAETEVYGRGFAPDARWESAVIDLGEGEPVTIGRVHYEVSHWRRDPESGVLAEDATGASRVEVELQTGTDEDPVVHLVYNDLGGLSEAPREVWMNLDDADILGGTEGPGYRGPRAEDRANWSFWSNPLPASGALARMPVGRYLRLRLRLRSDSPWAFARVHSVRVERGSLLADGIVGEVARGAALGAPRGDLPLLRAGRLEPVVLELRADFGGPRQRGFDGLRILSPLDLELDSLAVGGDGGLTTVPADSVVPEADGLAAYLPPGRRLGPGGDHRLRAYLRARLFGAASQLAVEVFDRTREDLAQQVADGDATDEISSNRMLVAAAEGSAAGGLGRLRVTPPVVTPQGDGMNEFTAIEYTVFHVLGPADVRVSVHRLDGTPVWRAPAVRQTAGRHTVEWRGVDASGRRVRPGLYVVRVEVDSEAGRESRVRPVAVAY